MPRWGKLTKTENKHITVYIEESKEADDCGVSNLAIFEVNLA